MPLVQLAVCFLVTFRAAQAGRIGSAQHIAAQEAEAEAAQQRCVDAVPAQVTRGHFGNQSAAGRCRKCVGSYGCKWCPLTQECVASGFFGNGCVMRPGMKNIDKKVKRADECETRGAAWEATLSQSYGKAWEADQRHSDVSACARWALDWPLSDSGFKAEGPAYDQDGRWACVSALIREGVLAMTGYKRLPAYRKQVKTANVEVWNPALCSIIKVKENKETCYVRGYATDQFAKLRRRMARPNMRGAKDITRALAASMAKGPIKAFNPGAGKSGSGFGATADGRFKVKFGLKHTNKMDEVKNIMDMVMGDSPDHDAGSLAQHFARNPNSLMNRQYALIKVAFGDIRTYVVVLDDAFYHVKDTVKIAKKRGMNVTSTAYDLKGASRDQTERSKGSTKLNGDFTILEHNQMQLTDSQCLAMRGAMQADVNFLSKYNIIDYSVLLMSVKRPQESSALVNCRRTPGEPYCIEHGERMYTISLIDYLNNYNWFKGLESTVRMCKFCDYGNSVMTYLKRICRTKDEQSFIEWINKVMVEEFGSSSAAFERFDEDKDGKLSEGELDTLFRSIRLSHRNSDRLLQEIDKDDDGAIRLEDFKMALEIAAH